MNTITLTREQLNQITTRAGNGKIEMLSTEEVLVIAKKVNEAIKLPCIGDGKELVVFIKIIKQIDQQLYLLLPIEYYELVKEDSDGISKEEAEKIKERLTPLINNAVNVPILSENKEGKLMRFILSLIIGAMVKGEKLEAL